jgi:hypothetical protein
MVKDSWFYKGRDTDLRRKWTTDRTNKDNLILSNCVGHCGEASKEYSKGSLLNKIQY